MSHPRARLAATAFALAGGWRSAELASLGTVGPQEERVFRSANDAPDGLHVPVWAVMQSGSLAAVFAAASLQARRPGEERHAAVTGLFGLAVWGGVKLIKPIVGRGRPEQHLSGVRVRGHAQSGLGYPSGHAAVSLTLAMLGTTGRPPAQRAAALGIAAVTGWARMYVGAHLPLDIVGGYAVGCLGSEAARLLAVATRETAPPSS